MSLIMVSPDLVVLLLLLVVGLPLCGCVVCCCDQCALLHICEHWNSSAVCSPSPLAYWGLLVIREPHKGVLSCDRVLCCQQIWMFCWQCRCIGYWCRWGKAVGPEHFLVEHLMLLVSSCWRFDWYKPFGSVPLTSSGSIGPHYLGCHAPLPLQEAVYVVPWQEPFESPGKWGPLLCCTSVVGVNDISKKIKQAW